jgi:hypothetical protein
MNALEMLLQRIRAPGLPPQDQVWPAPGQQNYSTQLPDFASGDEGIYNWSNRTVPAGDAVMPAEQDWWRWRQGPDMPAMPRVKPGAEPGGLTRIGAGGILERLEELRQAPVEPTYVPSERAWSLGQPLHPNAAGIFGGAPRPPPPGDVVLPPNDRSGELAIPWMPRSSTDEFLREDRTINQPSRLPGPYGATRISAGQGLPRGGPPSPQAVPSPEVLAALAARQREWQAQQPQGYAEGQIMAPEQWWNEAMGGQLRRLGPQREERLQFDRRQALGLDNPDTENPWLQAMPEGGVWSSRPPDISPFASPLNQLMRRLPYGQY